MTAPCALLDHLAAHLGLPPLALDAEGCCALRFGERTVVSFRWFPDDELLVMFSLLARLGLEHRAERLAELMRANHFWKGTGGATLAIDREEPPQVVLAERVDARRASPADFVASVEQFVESATGWAQRLDATGGPAPAALTPVTAPMPGPGSYA